MARVAAGQGLDSAATQGPALVLGFVWVEAVTHPDFASPLCPARRRPNYASGLVPGLVLVGVPELALGAPGRAAWLDRGPMAGMLWLEPAPGTGWLPVGYPDTAPEKAEQRPSEQRLQWEQELRW